jgi:hypothetical protein
MRSEVRMKADRMKGGTSAMDWLIAMALVGALLVATGVTAAV